MTDAIPDLDELDQLRVRGIRLLAAWLAAWTVALIPVGLLLHLPSAWIALPVAIANCAAPVLMALHNRHDASARIVVGIAAAVSPAITVFVFRGHPWQMDMHLFYMVNLAGLAILCDWRPLLAAAAAMAVNHLLGALFAPNWVFTGGGDIARVLIHGSAVAMEAGLLAFLTQLLQRLITAQSGARVDSDRLASAAVTARHEAEIACSEAVGLQARAERALARAEVAEAEAHVERTRRQAAEQAAQDERETALRTLAGSFERSVAAMMRSVEEAAQQLAYSAEELNDLARTSDRQAGAVVANADQASDAARDVADGVAHLSSAISGILAHVSEQADRSAAAQAVSRKGADAVRDLAGRATRIGEFAEAIRGIARTTNLVAINAAIEAARYDEAGRGFAVVAGEVKALAGSAANSTREIAELACEIHDSAEAADSSLQDIDSTLDHVATVASTIRLAVQTQRESTLTIEHSANNVASHAGELARNIEKAAHAADATRAVSDQVQIAANGLLETAQALRAVTVDFVDQLRAA
jgi:methyl-accepting chemotaxis protein